LLNKSIGSKKTDTKKDHSRDIIYTSLKHTELKLTHGNAVKTAIYKCMMRKFKEEK